MADYPQLYADDYEHGLNAGWVAAYMADYNKPVKPYNPDQHSPDFQQGYNDGRREYARDKSREG